MADPLANLRKRRKFIVETGVETTMEQDIAAAPAGYMFMYVAILVLFAWNLYRVVRLRSERVRIKDRERQDPNQVRRDLV